MHSLALTILNDRPVGAENYSADARVVFQTLEPDSKYADWIKNRINQYGFIENVDYVVEVVYTGRRPRKEYYVTLDVAKELCMVENNEAGRQARRYFIEAEKELRRQQISSYIAQISDQQAFIKKQAKHEQDRINGYKSQIAQHNAKISTLQAKNKALEIEVIEAKAKASNESLLKYTRAERDRLKEANKELKKRLARLYDYLHNQNRNNELMAEFAFWGKPEVNQR